MTTFGNINIFYCFPLSPTPPLNIFSCKFCHGTRGVMFITREWVNGEESYFQMSSVYGDDVNNTKGENC